MRYKYNATYLSTYQPSLTTTHNYATPTVFTYFHYYYYYHLMIQRVHRRLPGLGRVRSGESGNDLDEAQRTRLGNSLLLLF